MTAGAAKDEEDGRCDGRVVCVLSGMEGGALRGARGAEEGMLGV